MSSSLQYLVTALFISMCRDWIVNINKSVLWVVANKLISSSILQSDILQNIFVNNLVFIFVDWVALFQLDKITALAKN